MVLPILVIIASWIFHLPIEWAITLTVFASLHLIWSLISVGSSMAEK